MDQHFLYCPLARCIDVIPFSGGDVVDKLPGLFYLLFQVIHDPAVIGEPFYIHFCVGGVFVRLGFGNEAILFHTQISRIFW